MILELMSRYFPTAVGKIFPSAFSFARQFSGEASRWAHLVRPFPERDIDVLFVASDWARREKAFPLMCAIANSVKDLRVHVVGALPLPVASATQHGFLPDREGLFRLYSRARSVVCPSSLDASPGILYEGAAMGCNAVASRNCGNWTLCHPDLLALAGDRDSFVACVRRAVDRRYDDHLDVHIESADHDEFILLTAALMRPVVPLPRA